MLYETPVSHFTGNISQISVGIIGGNSWKAVQLLACFGLFFLGSFIVGLIHYGNRPLLRNRYEFVLAAQSFALILFASLWEDQMLFLIAFYMGIQNGVFVFYEDIRVRFTHMTGYLTEAALDTAALVRGKHTGKRVRFYFISILSFIMGGIVCSLFGLYKVEYLIPAAILLYYLLGTALYVLKDKHGEREEFWG